MPSKKESGSPEMKSVWESLSAIDCNDHTEDKNGFTYLSWAWAWKTLKEIYPTARFEKLGYTALSDGSGMVSVRVFIECGATGSINERIEYLEDVTEVMPVLNYSNKPISNPSCFDVNSAYQRGLVKCLAYMGLGMYIYQGEKMNPDAVKELVVTDGESKVDRIPEDKLKVVSDVLLEFMTGYEDDINKLRHFWALNKQPIDHLEKFDKPNYKRVFDAFMKKANELKGEE